MRLLELEVTDRGAIYINGHRVTNRSTKWGTHTIIFSVKTPANLVRQTLADNGFGHIKIDPEEAEQFGI